MFSITETAGAHLAGLLEREEAPEDVVVRLEQSEDGLAIRLGNAHPGDSAFTHEGRTVLVLDDEICQELADSKLDVEDTDEGPQLRLQ